MTNDESLRVMLDIAGHGSPPSKAAHGKERVAMGVGY